MRGLALTIMLTMMTAAGLAQEASELAWAKVAKGDLDGFQATAGNVRINNLIVARREGGEAAGVATEHEFSASVANRSDDRLRVVLQLVGVKPDGTPTLSAESYVDVEPRRNEQIRQSFRASPEAFAATQAVWVHASVAAP